MSAIGIAPTFIIDRLPSHPCKFQDIQRHGATLEDGVVKIP